MVLQLGSTCGLNADSLPHPRHELVAVAAAEPEPAQGPDFGQVDLPLLRSFSDHVRGYARCVLQDQANHDAGLVGQLHTDLSRLQILIDQLDPAFIQSTIRNVTSRYHGDEPLSKGAPYRAAFVIDVLLQANLLVSDSSLKASVKQALKMVMPKSLLPMFLDLVEQHIDPNTSRISRWRFLLDAAFMLYTRAERQKDWQQQRPCVRWMMVDSSPQGGRDYELIVMSRAYVSDLQHLIAIVDIMRNACVDRLANDPGEQEEDNEVFFMRKQNYKATSGSFLS